MRHPRPIVLIALLVTVSGGCNALSPTEPSARRSELVSRAGVQQSCEGAGRTEDRPFIITWDGTDVAEFESLAQRDTVFVRYAGCELDVIRTCRQDQVAGSLGAYGQPSLTTGSTNVVDIEDESSLRTQLPLGVASFGAKVAEGTTLKLTYHVAGVSQNVREKLYADELARIPGCSGVTHFVRAYNIGAFELTTSTRRSSEAAAGIDPVGVAGAQSTKDQRALVAGKLEACEQPSKVGCRVPIRLVLTRISPGTAPEAEAVSVSSAPTLSASDDFQAWTNQVDKVHQQAAAALRSGDAVTCLRTLEADPQFDQKASRNDPHAAKYVEAHGRWLELKSHCQAASGACAEARRTIISAAQLTVGGGASADEVDMPYLHREIDRYCGAASAGFERMNDAYFVMSSVQGLGHTMVGDNCAQALASAEDKLRPIKSTPLGALAEAHLQRARILCASPANGCATLERDYDAVVAAEAGALEALGRTAALSKREKSLAAMRDVEVPLAMAACAADKCQARCDATWNMARKTHCGLTQVPECTAARKQHDQCLSACGGSGHK